MAASDYVPIFFKNRLHLAGRPQMSTHPSGADLTFATHPAAASQSECQIQSSTRIKYLLVVL